ncbi:MAG: mechanosensitive ion channel [Bdellovibrionaceae bacterium]|nr:mechanosensitive ion channel [Bdellovibrionales bacterium]MCB9255163.1 mechanosensitive ion channel [Pseudobdellovibrionaceae bacterium]
MPSLEELNQIADFEHVGRLVEGHALRLGSGIAVLLFGWLIALVASGLTRKALQKANLGSSLEQIMGPEARRPVPVDRWVSRAVFYIFMLFVFIAFFEVLDLQVINEPLNRFLIKLFEFIPTLLGPIVLILIAWVVASFLRFLVHKLMGSSQLNQMLSKWIGIEGNLQNSAAQTVGNIIYWMVFLIFSLAILDTLNLQGLLEPLQQMFQQILGFLPNVFAALLILGFGWFFARVVQRILSNLTATVGVDRLSVQLGLQGNLGKHPTSHWLGVLGYILILIPVLIASLNALNLHSITQPVSEMLNEVLTTLPKLLAALLVLTVAYFAGRLLRGLVTVGLTNAGFNGVLAKMGIGKDPMDYNSLLGKMGIGEAPKEGTRTPSDIAGFIIFFGLMLFAGIESLEIVGFQALAQLLTRFVVFFGQVLLGLMIFGFAMFISNIVANTIRATGSPQSSALALVSRVAILVLAGAMALQQMGLAERIINLAFGIVLGAVALAAAMAFGLGGRDVAADLWREFINSLRAKRRS